MGVCPLPLLWRANFGYFHHQFCSAQGEGDEQEPEEPRERDVSSANHLSWSNDGTGRESSAALCWLQSPATLPFAHQSRSQPADHSQWITARR